MIHFGGIPPLPLSPSLVVVMEVAEVVVMEVAEVVMEVAVVVMEVAEVVVMEVAEVVMEVAGVVVLVLYYYCSTTVEPEGVSC